LEGLGARGCGPWWARREEGGRRRTEPAAAALQREKEGVAGCRRFRAARWSWLRGLWGARKSGRMGSAEA